MCYSHGKTCLIFYLSYMRTPMKVYNMFSIYVYWVFTGWGGAMCGKKWAQVECSYKVV